MNYWLMKSEPESFSINDLENRPEQIEHWDGVRNYQARNFMRDQMKAGDLAFMYHSSCVQPGIAGMMEIVKEGYPDYLAFDPASTYFDPKSDASKPTWFMVDVKYIKTFTRTITLSELKSYSELADLILLRRGNRLSIMPITKMHWDFILTLI